MFKARRVHQIKSKIVSNLSVGGGYFWMTLNAPTLSETLAPGQFLNIRCTTSGGLDPLLRRPFSPAGACPGQGEIEILYRVVGRGTQWLSLRRAGESLDVVGPLGNGFFLDPSFTGIAVVGRGVGMAPLLFLSQRANAMGISVYSFFSARGSERGFISMMSEKLQRYSQKLFLSTDPNEMITDRLRRVLSKKHEKIDAIYVCGSRRLLREVKVISQQYNITSQVSLEERMACGLGVCKGCVIKLKSADGWRYANVCVEGPVFPAQEVIIDD